MAYGGGFIWVGKHFNRVRKCLSDEPISLIRLPVCLSWVGKCFVLADISLLAEPKCLFVEPDGLFGVRIGSFGVGATFFHASLDKVFGLN